MDPASHVLGRLLGTHLAQLDDVVAILRPAPLQEGARTRLMAVVDLRQRYGWGSRKIRKLTAEKFGEAPARRTIDRIFERHDLITKKRRRSGKPGHPGKPLTPMDEPNAVWTVDFKGQFKMLNGRYCYPLTIQDGFSRFLLECRGLYSTSIELAKPVFIKVFRECLRPTPPMGTSGSDPRRASI